MVFGWGKKKDEQQDIPTKEIQLSEVQKIAKDLLDMRQDNAVSEIKSLRNQIEPLIKKLSNIANNLEKDDLKVDDIDKNIRVIVVRGKKQVIDIIKKESGRLSEVSTFDDGLELNNSLNQKLKKIGDVLGRQTRVIHIFAKKYADDLKQILASMNSLNHEIHNTITHFQDTLNLFNEISGLLEKIKETKEDSAQKSKRLSELETNLRTFEENIRKAENSIGKIKSKPEYEEYLKTKKKLSSFDETKQQIKEEIATHFTKISRPLGRYEYASSLDKDQKSLLSDLINEPFEVLIPSNRDSIIVILENVRKGINSGSVSVKDVEKTMSSLTEIEELLDELIRKVSEFYEKKKKIQDDLSRFDPKELTTIENTLKKTREQKEDVENKITLFKKEIKENSENLPKTLDDIEKLLKRLSKTEYLIARKSQY